MKEIDLERAAFLMDVIQKVPNVVPQMMALSGEAGEELKAIHQDCLDNQKERAQALKAEAAEAQAARLAQAQEALEADKDVQKPAPALKAADTSDDSAPVRRV